MPCARDGYVAAVRGIALGAIHRVGKDVGIGVTAHVQHRDRQRALHRPHESTALTAQLTAHRPALVLQRGMRGRRDLHGPAQMADGLREVLRRLPFGTRPTADQCFEFGGVVAGQHPLRPERQLVAQHPGEQRQALVAPRQSGGAQRDRVRGTDQRRSRARPAGAAPTSPSRPGRRRHGRPAWRSCAPARAPGPPRPRPASSRRSRAEVCRCRRSPEGRRPPRVRPSGREADAATTTRRTRTREGVSPAVARETPSNGSRWAAPRRPGSESRWRAPRDGAMDRRCASPTDRVGALPA